MANGHKNVQHALGGLCEDPDCEIHFPLGIEDESLRLTAAAWFIAGGERAVEMMMETFMEILHDRDTRLEFLRVHDEDTDIEFYPSMDAAQHFEQEDR